MQDPRDRATGPGAWTTLRKGADVNESTSARTRTGGALGGARAWVLSRGRRRTDPQPGERAAPVVFERCLVCRAAREKQASAGALDWGAVIRQHPHRRSTDWRLM